MTRPAAPRPRDRRTLAFEHRMVRTQHTEGLTRIWLNRPEKRNALTPAMVRQLVAAVADWHERSRVLVISGEGESFCAGFDLSLCRENDEVLADLLTGLYDAVAAMRRATCPVVVAAHGAAIAGGCALLGGADFVVTNAGAKLGYPVVRLGISPAVTAPFLRAAAGDAAARAMLLEGLLISGAAASRIGLASECVPRVEDVIPRALELAGVLAAKPPLAMQATRRWLGELDGTSSDTLARSGLRASLSLVGSDEQRERLAKLWESGPAPRHP